MKEGVADGGRVIPGKRGGWRPGSGRKRMYPENEPRPGHHGRLDLSLADDGFLARLRDKIVMGPPSSCWGWNGCKNWNGRPTINYRRRCIIAARAVFFMEHRTQPVVVMHMCDNPGCVNPSHLVGGTQKDNMRDMVSKNRHHNALILTMDDLDKIRRDHSRLGSYTATARVNGISRDTVARIIKNTWRACA